MSHSISHTFENFASKYPRRQDIIEQFYLQVIIDSYTRIRQIEGLRQLSENNIRNLLVLDIRKGNLIFWQYQKTVKLVAENQIVTEQHLFRTDLEFFVSQYGTYVIECKKLTGAEKRYITDAGKGGVERFTNLDYASDEEEAGMLGFIVKGELDEIVNNLKSGVAAFYPAKNIAYLLGQRCAEWESSFQSKHIRKNNTCIHLYHLFFDFVNC